MTKPTMPADLGSCYIEIAKQTKRADDAEKALAELQKGMERRLLGVERVLTQARPRAFYPGKFASFERGVA